MTQIELLESAVHEYRDLLVSNEVHRTKKMNTNLLVHRLSRTHDWTEEGARMILALANEHGTFMLRNALALAIALGKEDGNRGF
jgi:hypothetical protein